MAIPSDLAALKNPDQRCDLYRLIHLAASFADPAVFQALIEKGPALDAPTASGDTALMWSASEGRMEIVRMLIQAGADVNQRHRQNGNTALILAASYRHLAIVKTLLKAGADQTIHNSEGMTALGYAIKHEDTDIVELLKAEQ